MMSDNDNDVPNADRVLRELAALTEMCSAQGEAIRHLTTMVYCACGMLVGQVLFALGRL